MIERQNEETDASPGWGGHWRGENATIETVVCPLSYTTRQPLEALCGSGYTVADGKLNYYFASDLLHRLYHVATIGEGAIEHYADSYEECLALAVENPGEAFRNSHTLQYFALDAYAYDVVLPDEGCTGKPDQSSESESASSASPSSASVPDSSSTLSTSVVTSSVLSPTFEASTTVSENTSGTTSAAAVC